MSRKRAKKGDGGSQGAPEWMNTYGDMVTLLLTFFVLLFAFSSVDNQKWNMLIETFTGAPPPAIVEPIDPVNPVEGIAKSEIIPEMFQKPVENPSTEQTAQEGKETNKAVVEKMFSDLYEMLKKYIEGNNLESQVVATKDGQTVYITFTDGILFRSGSAEILPEGVQILTDVGNMFNESLSSIMRIIVEGHTDNVPIKTTEFEDNWDLSTKRATNVVREVQAGTNIPFPTFEALGKAEWHPVASNETEDGRQQNRRVRFIVESVLAQPNNTLS